MKRRIDIPPEWAGEGLAHIDGQGEVEACKKCEAETFLVIQGSYLTLGQCLQCGFVQELASG